jgi:hypothetical protein
VVILTFTLCAFAAALGGLALRWSVARYEPVRSANLGIFSVELRRRALVHEHPSGMGGQPFRQPGESRLRVFRVAGIPVWRQGCSVDLPLQVTPMIGTLTARDFDSEFDPRFRLGGFARLMPEWWVRRGGRGGKGGSGSGPGAKRLSH